MSEYDRWLEQPYQEAAERDEAIDAEVERLLSEEYDPLNIENFYEAIMFDVLGQYEEQIAKALVDPTPNFDALGRVVFDAVYAHWRNKAEALAAHRYNSGLGQDDYDPD